MFSPGVEEGRKPRRRPRDSSVGKFPSTPPGRRTDCLTGKCDTLSGSYLFMMIDRSPGSSALRASTTGLNAGDPSAAPPLRDRQAGRHYGSLLFITSNDVFVLLIVLLHLFPFLGKRHTDMVFLLILDILVTSRHALTADRLGKVTFLPRKKAVVT